MHLKEKIHMSKDKKDNVVELTKQKDKKNEKKTEKPTYKNTVDNLDDATIEAFANFFSGEGDDKDLTIVKENAERVVNIGDLLAVVAHLDKVQKTYYINQLKTMVQRISILEKVIMDKLEPTEEDMERYKKEFEEEQKVIQEQLKKLYGQSEDDTDEQEQQTEGE